MGGCELLVESTDPGLCRSHVNRWRTRGRLPLEAFVAECATFADPVFDLRPLPSPMRLEIAYGLQCRVDDHRTKTLAKPLRPLLGLLAVSGASSLLDRPLEDWLADLLPVSRWGSMPRAFVRYTVERLEVKVDRPGVTVASRRAYSLKTPGKPPTPPKPQKKK